MKIQIEREKLLGALQRASGASAYALIRADGAMGSILTNDLEQTLSESFECVVIERGELLIKARDTASIVKSLPKGATVDLSHNDGIVTIRSERYTSEMPSLPVEEFPLVSSTQGVGSFTINGGVLKKSIESVLFAISSEDTRYSLQGIHVHAEDDRVKFVASDGNRLAVSRIMRPDVTGDLPPVIIPKRFCSDIVRLINTGSDVTVSISERRIDVDLGYCQIGSRLIDAVFPDYKRIIPKENNIRCTVPKQMLSDALSRVSAATGKKSGAVTMRFEGQALMISSENDSAKANDVIDLEESVTSPIAIGFQGRYIADVLGATEGDAEFAFKDHECAAIIRDTGNEDALFIIMPMRV